MPLKIDALIADTTHMTTLEFGAYCKILFAMWRHGARLKDDGAELALIAGVTNAKWDKIAEKVRRPLTSAGGEVSQHRMTSTWLEVKKLRAKRAQASEKRWENERMRRPLKSQENINAIAYAEHNHVHVHLDSTCNANQNQTSKILTSIDSECASESLKEVFRKKKW